MAVPPAEPPAGCRHHCGAMCIGRRMPASLHEYTGFRVIGFSGFRWFLIRIARQVFGRFGRRRGWASGVAGHSRTAVRPPGAESRLALNGSVRVLMTRLRLSEGTLSRRPALEFPAPPPRGAAVPDG